MIQLVRAVVKGDGDMSRLRSLQPFQEPLVQLRDQVETLTEEYITQVLEHASLKQKEQVQTRRERTSPGPYVTLTLTSPGPYVTLTLTSPGPVIIDCQAEFQTALDHAKGEADRESKVKIAEYDALAKSSLTGDVDNPTQALQMLHKANDALYEQLMDLEISESERYAESIPPFEPIYYTRAPHTRAPHTRARTAHTRMHARTCTHTHERTRTCTHTIHAHTHTHTYNTRAGTPSRSRPSSPRPTSS